MPRKYNDGYMLRMPDGWREVIKEQSKSERISMNSYLLNAIETAMRVKGVQLNADA